MSGPSIRVAADVSAVKRAIDEVVEKVKEVGAASTGSVKLDTGKAKQQLDALQQAVDKLKDSLAGETLDVEGAAEAAGAINLAADAAERLEAALSGKGPANAQASTAAQMRRTAAEMERVRRVQEVLAREGIKLGREQAAAAKQRYDEWRSSGARGTRKLKDQQLDDFLDGGWRKTSLNELDARRARRDVLGAIGLQLPGGGGDGPRSFGAFTVDAAARAFRGVAGATLPVGGPGGAIMRNAATEAAATEGGLLSGAGMARLAAGAGIGALAFGAIKGVRAVAGKVGDAEQEDGAYADLSRQLGATAGEFDALKTAVRGTTYGLGIAYSEAVKLAQAYAHEAALGPKERARLGGEVRGAAEFSRGFGLDPSRGVGFFAAMRHMGASSGEEGNRRLALLIADAMSKKGDFGRTGELVDAVHSFVATTTARAMAPANVAGFTDFVARFSGLNIAGMGSGESAGLVSRLDQGYRAGGGEAGQNFRLSLLQRVSRDVNAMDLQTVGEGGFLATGESLFGKGSARYKAAERNRDAPEMARLERMARDFGDGPAGLREIRALIDHYRGNGGTVAAASALQGMYGLSSNEANSAIAAAMGGGSLPGVGAKLKAAGVDMSAVSMKNLGLVSSLAGADRAGLERQAQELLSRKGEGALDAKERARLEAAMKESGGTEDLRSAVLQLVAGRNMANDGEKTRDSITSLQNVLQDMASKLVPLTTSIRDAVVGLALKFRAIDKETAWAGRGAEARAALDLKLRDVSDPAKRREIVEAEMARAAKDDRLPDSYLAGLRAMRFEASPEGVGPAPRDEVKGARRQVFGGYGVRHRSKAQLIAGRSEFDPLFERIGQQEGVDPLLLKTIAAQESGLNPLAIGKNVHADGRVSYDRGLMQLNSRFDRERGTEGDRALDPETNVTAAAKLLRRLLDRNGGDVRAAVRGYNGAGPMAERYADEVLPLYAQARAAAELQPQRGAPLPGGRAASGSPAAAGHEAGAAAPAGAHPQKISFEHRITLVDQQGRERAAPIVTTATAGPTPAGVR